MKTRKLLIGNQNKEKGISVYHEIPFYLVFRKSKLHNEIMNIDYELQEILRILNEQEFVPTPKLAIRLSKTNRTIRTYLTRLNEYLNHHGAAIESVYGKGNRLIVRDESRYALMCEQLEETSEIKNDRNSRMVYYLSAWLFKKRSLLMEDMEEKFFQSKKQIRKDWNDLSELFSYFECSIENKPYVGTYIQADSPFYLINLVMYIILKDLYGCRQYFTKVLGIFDINDKKNVFLKVREQFDPENESKSAEEIDLAWADPQQIGFDEVTKDLRYEPMFRLFCEQLNELPECDLLKKAIVLASKRISNRIFHICPFNETMKKKDPLAWLISCLVLKNNVRESRFILEDEIGELSFYVRQILEIQRKNEKPTAYILCFYPYVITQEILSGFKRCDQYWKFQVIRSLEERKDKNALLITETKQEGEESIVVPNLMEPKKIPDPSLKAVKFEDVIPPSHYQFRLDPSLLDRMKDEQDLILLNCSNCLVMCDREALKGVSIYTLKNPIRYKESKVKIVIKVNLFGLSWSNIDGTMKLVSCILSDSILQNQIIRSETYENFKRQLMPYVSETFGNIVSYG